MNKREIYFKYALLPEEDGTFVDYLEQYMEHPQTNPEILKRACQEFSDYVGFCMDIAVSYKSKNKDKYVQIARDGDELDYEDYQINLFWQGIKIYKDTDLSTIDYPNIENLIKMNQLKEGYRGIFKRLLRGETFLSIG